MKIMYIKIDRVEVVDERERKKVIERQMVKCKGAEASKLEPMGQILHHHGEYTLRGSCGAFRPTMYIV